MGLENPRELLQGKQNKRFRGCVMYLALNSAKFWEMNNVKKLNKKILDIHKEEIFETLFESGIEKNEITPDLKKDFDYFFTFAWNEWMAGRGRDLVD
jgi:hypothetical protein